MRRIQGQSDSSSRIARERRHEDALAVIGIGDMSGEQHEEHLREELRQSRVTQIQRGMRALVNFPPDGDLLHLPAEDEDHIAGEIPAERRQAPGSVGVVGPVRMCRLNQLNQRAGIALTFFAQYGNNLALDESVSGKLVIQHRVTRGA